jgi:hypothetical protein
MKVKVMELKYKNHSRNGLKNNHEYVVRIYPPRNKIYCYTVHFVYDITEQEEMDMEMTFASQISLKNNFEFNKLELEE